MDESMQISWKKNSLKPEVLLKKIESLTTVGELPGSKTLQEYFYSEYKGTKIFFLGLDYYSAFMALTSMVKMPDDLDGIDLEELVSITISNLAGANNFSEDGFIKEINQLAKKLLAVRPERYQLLSSISLAGKFSLDEQLIEGSSKITISSADYPESCTSREKVIQEIAPGEATTHEGYSILVVSVEEKLPQRATYMAFRAIDLTRAILALKFNPETDENEASRVGHTFNLSSRTPINTIRLGKFHTLHDAQGKPNEDEVWIEPHFEKTRVVLMHDSEKVEEYFSSFLEKLRKCKYADDIKEALIQYVRSLDTGEHHANFILLWAVLERLTTHLGERGNHEAVVSRCASIFEFEELSYHRQILEYLRLVRNSSVHDGIQSDRAKIHCYELQRYVIAMIKFHVGSADFFKSKDEALQFLDLPHHPDELLKRQRLVNQAVVFRGFSS
jgi:hypothetical protein